MVTDKTELRSREYATTRESALERAVNQLVEVTAWYNLQAEVDYFLRTQRFKQVYGKWNAGREYYHLARHFNGIRDSMLYYVHKVSVLSEPSTAADPLHLLEDLRHWNEQHGTAFTLKMFEEICTLFATSHDNGNNTRYLHTRKKPEGTELQPVRFYWMNENCAEERSCEIQRVAISAKLADSGCDPKAIGAIIELLNHMTMMSKYDPGIVTEERRNLPFYRFVTVNDQIGATVFTAPDHYGHAADRPMSLRSQAEQQQFEFWREATIGLMLEKIEAKIDTDQVAMCNPHAFFNFVSFRLPELLPDQAEREAAIRCFDFAIPSITTHVHGVQLPDKEVEIVTFLNSVSAITRENVTQAYQKT